jgi:hypothetical protein
MKNNSSRIILYAVDVQNMTGRHIRTCYEILEKIRIHYNKKKKAPVTVREFAEFMTIPEALVREFMIS